MESISYSRGFTLTELIAVLAIISVISAVVITSQSNFNKDLLLTNAAYDIALTLRSVQTYGLGSRAVGGAQNVGHGLSFVKATPNEFTHFADIYPLSPSQSPAARPGNGVYDVSQGEKVLEYQLGNGITIKDFCSRSIPSNQWRCASDNQASLTALDISFSRPNADPSIRINSNDSLTASEACIITTSPQGGERFVSVTASGQIHTKATSCP